MNQRLLSLLTAAALALCLLSGCSATPDGDPAPEDTGYSSSGEFLSPDDEDAVPIVFADGAVKVDGRSAETDNGELTLSNGGVYRISGSGTGRLVVDAADTEDVTLILDGCDLWWPDDEVLFVKTAHSAVVVLTEGTENILVSGEEPTADAILDETASGAALRAKCPLAVTGSGTLYVCGYVNNGIASTDDITVDAGVITVTAVNDGLKSRADITINAGVLTIYSDMDAIQADGELTINAGTLTLHTGSGAEGADMKVSDSLFMGMGGGPGRRASSEASSETEDGAASAEAESDAAGNVTEETAELAGADAVEAGSAASAEADEGADNTESSAEPGGFPGAPWDMDDEDAPSRKAMKAAGINLNGGSVWIDAEDDAIHSDGPVTVTGGDILARSGDDGVHADEKLIISGGTLDIQYCYEGLEAKSVLIEDGIVRVAATDDGMNVNGGSSFGFPSGEASEEAEETDGEAASGETAEDDDTGILRITGGTVLVDSGGDGLDSNGSVYVEGGTVLVSGPSSNWDAAIDRGEGSAEFIITGGIVMAGGYAGMAEAPGTAENSQPSIYYAFSDYAEDGALCKLTDPDGNVVLAYSFAHGYNCVVLSSPDLVVGETYTLTVGDQQAEIELSSVSFSNRTRGGSREPSGESASPSDAESAG